MNTEDQQKLERFISLLRSHVAGEKLQFKYPQGWDSALGGFRHACWEDFNPSNWRVEPDAPKVAPWDFQTAPEHPIKVRRNTDGSIGVLNFFPDIVTFTRSPEQVERVEYDALPIYYDPLDGSPCGIEQKEESEWPKWALHRRNLYRCDSENGPIWYHDPHTNDFKRYQGFEKTWMEFSEDGYLEIPAAEAERIIEAAKGVTK